MTGVTWRDFGKREQFGFQQAMLAGVSVGGVGGGGIGVEREVLIEGYNRRLTGGLSVEYAIKFGQELVAAQRAQARLTPYLSQGNHGTSGFWAALNAGTPGSFNVTGLWVVSAGSVGQVAELYTLPVPYKEESIAEV